MAQTSLYILVPLLFILWGECSFLSFMSTSSLTHSKLPFPYNRDHATQAPTSLGCCSAARGPSMTIASCLLKQNLARTSECKNVSVSSLWWMLCPLATTTCNGKIEEMFPSLITGIMINYAAVCFISMSAGLLTEILKLHPFPTSMAACCLPPLTPLLFLRLMECGIN